MERRKDFEFSYMHNREKLKLYLLKAFCWVWTIGSLANMIFWNQTTSSQLLSAGGVLTGAFFYINLCHVRSEVVELFEPPYPMKGLGVSIIVGICLAASIYFQILGD